jgi:acyl-CoA thioesterase
MSDSLRQLVANTPFNRLLGLELEEVHDDGVTIRCALKPELMNGSGTMHGGVIATLVDAVVGIALYRHFDGTRKMATTELKLNYLRPLTQGTAVARAKLVRIGQHLCVGQAEVFDHENQLAAIGIVSYLFTDLRQ